MQKSKFVHMNTLKQTLKKTQTIKNKKEHQIRCMGCQIDAYFKKYNYSEEIWNHEKRNIESLPFEVQVFYIFISISQNLNLSGDLTPFLFNKENITNFLSNFLAQEKFYHQMSLTKLKKFYGILKKIITFLTEEGDISNEEKERILENFLSFKEIRAFFKENQNHYSSIPKKEGLKWRKTSKTISKELYKEDLKEKIDQNIDIDTVITDFSWELAEVFRKNLAQLSFKKNFQHIQKVQNMLVILIFITKYCEDISSAVLKKKGNFTELEIAFYYNFFRSKISSLIWELNIFPSPSETIDFFFDGLVLFLETSCKECNYKCLMK